MTIRYVFKSLMLKKWFVVLTIIQMVFGFVLLNNALLLNKSLNNRKSIITGLIGKNNIIHLSNYSSGEARRTEEQKNKLLELVDYIKKTPEVESVGSFKNDSILIGEDDIKEFDNSNMMVELEDKDKNLVRYISLPAVFLDDEMYNMMNIGIQNGRELLQEDYSLEKGSEIPVLIGNDLKNFYKPGDVIMERNDIKSRQLSQYKVVGILKKGQKFLGGDATLSSLELKDMDKAMIIPFTKEDDSLEDYYIRYAINCSYKLKNGASTEKIMNDVDKKSNELNLTLKSVSYLEEIKQINSFSNEGIFYNAFLATMLTFFSLLGVVSSMMLSIIKNKVEYGIRMAVGATPKDISKHILWEMVVIFILTILIANIVMIVFPQLRIIPISESSDYLVFLWSSIIVFVVAAIASIIPAKKISSLDVSDLLKRGE